MIDTAARDTDVDLLREALDGLFDIAREDNPPEVLEALRHQLDGLPPETCQELLDEMVDIERLNAYLEKAGREGFDPEVPAFGADEMRKVDAVLDPLARLDRGQEGVRSLHQLSDDQRAHILFDSLGRGQR